MKSRYKEILAVLAALLVVVLGVFYFLKPPTVKEKAENETLLHAKKNIVVLGVDRRSGDTGRSDTLFVLMLDTSKNQASLLSIPRDTLVRIPGHGWDKINHAYAFGGYGLTMSTVENLLGLRIDDYVIVDFQGFVKLVDAIGGVDINVEKRMQYQDPYDGETGLVINLQPGRQHMDGLTAIQYVRYRDEDGDIGRIIRQQKFMKAVFQKLRGMNLVVKAPEIAKILFETVQTDLSIGDLGSLLMTFAKNVSGISQLDTAMVQGTPAYLDEVSYWIPNMTALRQQVAQLQGVQPNSGYRQAAQDYKKQYDRLLGANSTEPTNGKSREIKASTKELKDTVARTKSLDKEQHFRKKENLGTVEKKQQDSTGAKAVPAPQPPKARAFKATIVNCSGNKNAGAQAAAQVSRAGFTVLQVITGNPMEQTQVLINAVGGSVEERVQSLPFSYQLMRGSVSPSWGDVVVYVGRDYAE